MMEQIHDLRSALGDVPVALITRDVARVLDGVYSSLEIIERSDRNRPVVALVGPTGAGKSYVFNAIVGRDISPEGVLRPTTSSVVIAGDPSVRPQDPDADTVSVPDTDFGFTLVDVPGHDGGPSAAADLISEADLIVLVVSPIRYADATVVDLWKALDPMKARIVLNRVATAGEETSELLDSVLGVYGTEPYVIREGGEGRESIADHLAASMPPSRSSVVASIMVRAAVAGSRFIVREVTNAAPDIGQVSGAIDDVADCAANSPLYDVQDSWQGTRDEIIARVAIDMSDRDDTVVTASDTGLADRILESMSMWDGEDLSQALDVWRSACVSTYSDAASFFWRRSNARQLIERFSWSTAINPGIVPPKRFSRIMGAELDATSHGMRTALENVVCEHMDARLALWVAELDRFGDYQPGMLASAVDAFDGRTLVRE